jgi:CRISPR-associated protein Cmr1
MNIQIGDQIIIGQFFSLKFLTSGGKFEATFKVPEEIKETIFFPLLNFMDKYGYWGDGWDIGYGRLKVKK